MIRVSKHFISGILFAVLVPFATIAQMAPEIRITPENKVAPHNWHLLDRGETGYYGISLNKAYDFLKGRKSKTVIVAVIDSGIDTLHEDLKSILWTNPGEIPGNGIDDDHNGYVDEQYRS